MKLRAIFEFHVGRQLGFYLPLLLYNPTRFFESHVGRQLGFGLVQVKPQNDLAAASQQERESNSLNPTNYREPGLKLTRELV